MIYIILLSDTVAGLLSAIKLGEYRRTFPLARYVAILLYAFVIWQGCQFMALSNSPLRGAQIHVRSSYVLWVVGGRVPWSIAMWRLALYMLNIKRNGHSES